MKAQQLIDAIESALNSGKSMADIITEGDVERGFLVIRPGEVDWLPLSEWEPATIVSLQAPVVRLVAIWARQPGNGSFRRLCEALKAKGLVPHVVAPLPEMKDKLRQWKWNQHVRCKNDLDREEWWTPRSGRRSVRTSR